MASVRLSDGVAAIFNNDGTGNFDKLGSGVIPSPRLNQEIAVGDLNGDGLLDLFLATSGAISHQIYFGQ
mgnify:CR=1 FL=1